MSEMIRINFIRCARGFCRNKVRVGTKYCARHQAQIRADGKPNLLTEVSFNTSRYDRPGHMSDLVVKGTKQVLVITIKNKMGGFNRLTTLEPWEEDQLCEFLNRRRIKRQATLNKGQPT